MAYINTKTGRYPLSAADVRAAHPNTSFPAEVVNFEAAIAVIGYAVVQQVPQPVVAYTQNITEGAPKKTDGDYIQTWVISKASDEEVTQRTASQLANVRQERSQLLADCDWTQLPDATVDQSIWAAYRQALRDISLQPGFPWNVTWPEKP